MPKPALIDLDALTASDRLPKVRLFGRELTVRPLTGAAAHKIATIQDAENGNANAVLGPLLEVIAGCVPELTPTELDQLTVDQIAALLQLSRGQVAEVEEMLAEQATAQLAEQSAGNG
jgi:hypothetical protein